MDQQVVVGIDGGGTFTRAAVADFEGNVLGFAKTGGSHPGKNHYPCRNVKEAIEKALKQAGVEKGSVRFAVSGFAGLDEPEDHEWATRFLKESGLSDYLIVNDAVIAQYGAFLGGSGILAIAGTGSIVLGKTESGRLIRNYDFHHDTEASARFLSYSVIYDLISHDWQPENEALLSKVLRFWDVETLENLRELASRGFCSDHIQARQRLSEMGSIVSMEAEQGNTLAIKACEKVIDSMATGVGLVASLFKEATVPLALVGGVARNPFMQQFIHRYLDNGKSDKSFDYQLPQLAPVLGAILYAINEVNGKSPEVADRLLANGQKNDFY